MDKKKKQTVIRMSASSNPVHGVSRHFSREMVLALGGGVWGSSSQVF